MFVNNLLLITGFLAWPGQSFVARPEKSPVDTISPCTSWAVAEPQDTCDLLAEKNAVPLGQLLRWVSLSSAFYILDPPQATADVHARHRIPLSSETVRPWRDGHTV